MLRRTELVVDAKSKDAASKVLMEMYGEAGAKQDESRLYRRINQNAKQGQRKGSGGRSSHHPGYYGGCGGGDGSRADDNGGGIGADTDGGIGGGCDSGGGGCGGGCGGDHPSFTWNYVNKSSSLHKSCSCSFCVINSQVLIR
ncbi:hypothetical protein YC2023_109556 [Brassica napus]